MLQRDWVGSGGKAGPPARALAATVDVDAASSAVAGEILEEVWPDRDEPDFRGALDRSVHANVSTMFDIVLGRETILGAQPQGAYDFAATLAQLGVAAGELERGYRVGVANLWTQWFDLAAEHSRETGVPLEDLVRAPTLTFLAYIDRILTEVVHHYDNVRGELQRTRSQLRRLLILQVLDGSAPEELTDLDQRLDYCVDDVHLGLLLQGGDGHAPERTIATLREAVDARGSLVLLHGPRSWFVWLGRPPGFGTTQLARLRRALQHLEMTVTVSEPSPGLDGLRVAFERTIEASRIQHALGADTHRVLWAADVRLEALMLGDHDRARRFVADELGRLAADDALASRLRETLMAWLATGSHVNAAATLGVHENTVRNRVRQAEELVGTPLHGRRTELQVALRLERVLRTLEGSRAELPRAG
jgi:hypothetical protein